MHHQIIYPNGLFTSVACVLVGLLLLERLAARALSARHAAWHRHYAQLPAGAAVVAEWAWKNRIWVTAYLEDPEFASVPALQIISRSPLTAADRTACLRWLRTEGFDPAAERCVEPDRDRTQ